MNPLVANMNKEQSEAVRTTEGPLLIMAKVKVLVKREYSRIELPIY